MSDVRRVLGFTTSGRALPRFNADASKIGYNDLNSNGEWTAMVLDIKTKNEIEFDGKNFLGWVYSPEGIVVTEKINQDIIGVPVRFRVAEQPISPIFIVIVEHV